MALVPFTARADIYEIAFFLGQLDAVTGSLSDIGLTGSGVMSGNFVFDPQMIPPAGSGTESVVFSSMPVITEIPNSVAFLMNLDGITSNLSDFLPGTGSIQYVNGSFDGFDGKFDFISDGQEYQFVENGSGFEIELLENYRPTGDIVVFGTINFGPYSPINQPPCDELSVLSSFGNRIGGIGSGDGAADSVLTISATIQAPAETSPEAMETDLPEADTRTRSSHQPPCRSRTCSGWSSWP
jgi:hypothetical protein